MRGRAEDKNYLTFYLSYLSLNLFIKRWFSLSCLGVQVVFDYKFCLLYTICIWGAFLPSSELLVFSVIKKCNSYLYLLSCIKQCIPISTRRLLYNTYTLHYCELWSVIWGYSSVENKHIKFQKPVTSAFVDI